MRIDRLSRLLQTLAFCLVIASLKAYFESGQAYAVSLVYSIAIGTCIWALIDFGRERIDPGSDTGWPRGWRSAVLLMVSIPAGFAIGISAGDLWFGWSSWRDTGSGRLMRSAILTVMASAVVAYFFHSRGHRARLALRARQARREATEARLKLLEAQLEPHMLFNTLANLRALIGTEPSRAEHMLDHLVAYLRATLDGARAAWHPLSDEFARLDDYLALMAIRMGDRLSYALHLPPDLADAPIPPLLLQPLVENAIRHGLEPRLSGGHVEVRAEADGDALRITVSDTGEGLGEGLSRPGFGTRQVRERLATAWGDAAEVRFLPMQPNGTRVVLRWRDAARTPP
ncbi:sensor histidine kinase [Xylophilus sp. Kf1]|nr:sensor histidine kinase [Xylophilus sp. Kf1]